MDIVVISAIVGSLGLFIVFPIVLGFRELLVTHGLKKHAKSVIGRVRDVTLRSAGQAGAYGRVWFEYQVDKKTYHKT